ncbi:hypothetical protein NP493_2g13053 [Ridgeia piscesae]|uniref:Calponin-homology (CH) domain-containing protein n=1 Tax=Ridgeia piscesae TaxID=27915 RepID=A0AAD9PG23_RIDPI|nr:hypothetical protein NP493_2g13053 [Ridgeia piscesae]
MQATNGCERTPDLVDFRQVQRQAPRTNLDMAFQLFESEFGVTPLLDAEDIDVPHPDEKSLITYVSSLYDVFPQVPSVEDSLRDNEKQLKWEQYQELASSLVEWLQVNTANIHVTYLFTCFSLCWQTSTDFAGKMFHQDWQRSKDWVIYFLNYSMCHLWDRFTMAQQEKDMAIQAEIARLERLQRLAEKVHRDCRSCEEHLGDIETRINQEEQRVERVHPLEAKKSCDGIASALKRVEENIRGMFSDVQVLKEGRYHQAEQMYRRVYRIHEQWSTLHARLQNSVLPMLTSRTFVQEGVSTTRRRELVTEVELDNTGYGKDMESTRDALEFHMGGLKEISDYRINVERCGANKSTLQGEEAQLYGEWLRKLESAYLVLTVSRVLVPCSILTNTSSHRLQSLHSLLEFMDVATKELIWLNETEETEISRDWSSSELQLDEVEEYYQALMRELESRETQFRAVQDKGESLVMERHPAAKVIEAYMAAMQTQWAWLVQLTTICLETHLKNAAEYHRFFGEARKMDQWIDDQAHLLNTYYNRLEEMHSLLSEYQAEVDSLVARSHDIIPLELRGHRRPITRKLVALCSYKHLSSADQVEGAEQPGIQVEFDKLKTLWIERQRQLKQDMIFATIQIVKSWDLEQVGPP